MEAKPSVVITSVNSTRVYNMKINISEDIILDLLNCGDDYIMRLAKRHMDIADKRTEIFLYIQWYNKSDWGVYLHRILEVNGDMYIHFKDRVTHRSRPLVPYPQDIDSAIKLMGDLNDLYTRKEK